MNKQTNAYLLLLLFFSLRASQVIENIGRTNPDAVWLVLVKYDGKKALPALPGFDRLPASLKKVPAGWPQPSSVSTDRVNKLLLSLK